MLRPLGLFAVLLATAPASAQTAAPPTVENTTPPPEFIAAAQAFGQCLARTVQPGGVAARESVPEVAAHQALAGCVNEKAALTTRFEAWIAMPTFPAAARTSARTQFTEQMNGLEARLAGEMRAKLAARATATPAPTPTPRP